ADVVMAFDHRRRLADDRHRLDHVGIQSPLREIIHATELLRLGLEHVDERLSDDLPLALRIDDAREPVEKQLRRVHEDDRQLQPQTPTAKLRRMARPRSVWTTSG